MNMPDFHIKLHVEMWQSQSYWPLKGWSSPLTGLPHFTSVLLPPAGCDQFPKNLLPPPGWSWEGEWRIDSSPQNGGTDQSGWCYASNFDKLKSYLKINKPIGSSSKTSMVRTRRWIRVLECNEDLLNDFLLNRIGCLQHYREAVEIVLRKKQLCVQEIIRYEDERKSLFSESVQEISRVSLLTFSNIQSLGIQLKFFEKFIKGRIESERSFLEQFERSFPHVMLPTVSTDTLESRISSEELISSSDDKQNYNSVLHKTDSIPHFSLSDTPLPESYTSLSNLTSSQDVASFYASPISALFFDRIFKLSEVSKKSSVDMIAALEDLLDVKDEEGDSLTSILTEIERLLKEQRDLFRKNSDICRFSEVAVRNFLTSINIAFESITHNCLYDVSFLTEELSILNGTVPFLPAYFMKVKDYGTLPSSDLHNAFLTAITNSLHRSTVTNKQSNFPSATSGPIRNMIKNRRESLTSTPQEDSSRTMSTVSNTSNLLANLADEHEQLELVDDMLNDIMRQREHFQWNMSSTIPDIIEPYNYHQPSNVDSSASSPNYFHLSLGQPRDDLWLSLQRYLLAVKESQTSLGSLLEALCYLDQSLQLYSRKAHKIMKMIINNYSNFELEQGLGIKNNEKIFTILKELLNSLETLAYPRPALHTNKDTPQYPGEVMSVSKIPSLSSCPTKSSSPISSPDSSPISSPSKRLSRDDSVSTTSHSHLFSYLKLYELKFPSNPMVIYYDNLIYMSKSKFRSILKDPNSSYLTTFNDKNNWQEIFVITTSDGYLHLFFNNELSELPSKSFYLKQCVVNEIIKTHGSPNTHQYIFDISLNAKNKRVGSNILHDGGIFKCLNRNSYHKWLEILPRLTLLPCSECEIIEDAIKDSLEDGRPRFPYESILPFEDYIEKINQIEKPQEISDSSTITLNDVNSPPDEIISTYNSQETTNTPITQVFSNPLANKISRNFPNSIKDKLNVFEKKNLSLNPILESEESPSISPSISPTGSVPIFPSPRLKATDVVFDNSKYINNKPKPTQPYNPYPISPTKIVKINKKLTENYEELSAIVISEEAEKDKVNYPYFVYSNEFLTEKPERRVSTSMVIGNAPIATDLKPAQILPLNYDSKAPLTTRKSLMIDQYQQGLEADKQRSISKVKQTRGRTLREFNIADKQPAHLMEELSVTDDTFDENYLSSGPISPFPVVSIDELVNTLKEVEGEDDEEVYPDEAQL